MPGPKLFEEVDMLGEPRTRIQLKMESEMKDVWNLSAKAFGDTSRGKECRGLQQIYQSVAAAY